LFGGLNLPLKNPVFPKKGLLNFFFL